MFLFVLATLSVVACVEVASLGGFEGLGRMIGVVLGWP